MKVTGFAMALGCVGLQQVLALPRQPLATLSKRGSSNSSASTMLQLSSDEDFHFEILRDMSFAPYEGSDVGELLLAANQIKAGNFESYSSVFNKLAARVHDQAAAIDSSKHPVSARNAFFKSSTYYRSADFYLHGNWSDPRINSYWKKQMDDFDSAISLLPVAGERIELDAKDGSFKIPAIFFGSGKKGPRPTLILGNGFDGSQEEMFHAVGMAALQRGMNVITYEGPGQPTVRREQHLGFIPQWEKVATPVVDYLHTRPEVDRKSIGLWGLSFGGYLAPRAAAFEHRLAAVLAVDGIYSFGEALLDNFPDVLKDMFHAHKKTEFDAVIEKAVADPSTPTSLRWSVDQGLWSFDTTSPYEWISRAQEYNLTDLTDKIQAPVFVAGAQNDMFFPDQPQILSDQLGSNATFVNFKTKDGAGEHCSLGASILLNQVALDWFEDVLEDREA